MNFLEFDVTTDPETAEILMAELAEAGFDTFEETETGFKAYTEEKNFDKVLFETIEERYRGRFEYRKSPVPKTNWNETWEKNFSPVTVANRCRVRASFHPPDPSFPLEIIINPKMSFGTGHHATTALMLEYLLETDCAGKAVADAGCGTGILAIAASKGGADRVTAFDTDEWAVENAIENTALNECTRIDVYRGNAELLCGETNSFDVVLANIQLNVLVSDLGIYSKVLRSSGLLFMSGFYEDDIPVLVSEASRYGLELYSKKEKNGWAALGFKKL